MTRRQPAPGSVNGHEAVAPEAAARGRPGPHEGTWEHLARLHAELSRCYGDLACQTRNQVAEGSEQSDITSVKLLTVSDLAERLAVDVRTIRRWRTEGRLPNAIEIGGVIRWDPEVVARWLKEQRG